jgi:hypothetical protein
MTKAATFDWSALDRNLIAGMVNFASESTVCKSLSPVAFATKIRKIFRFFEVPVKVRSVYNSVTDKNSVWVGGLYDSVADKQHKTAITIALQFNSNLTLTVTQKHFQRLCFNIADTVLHEVIHMRQYRRRGFKDIPGYESTANLARKRNEQTYLGHDDEIDAYSFNIACQLLERFKGDKLKIINYLNKDLQDKRLKKDGYRMYLEVFDHNHGHRVIRKLKKKVINYLPNAVEIAKPYKTSDWLKK